MFDEAVVAAIEQYGVQDEKPSFLSRFAKGARNALVEPILQRTGMKGGGLKHTFNRFRSHACKKNNDDLSITLSEQ